MPPPATGAEPYRLPQSQDAVWPPAVRAYGGPQVARWKIARLVALMTLRLILPVILTLVLLGASYLYADAVYPLLGAPQAIRGALLATSDLVLPMTWFSIHLTNRRYGPAHAFAQLLAALVLGLVIILINPYDLNDWVATLPALTMPAVMSFGVAFLVANFVGIAFFDAARGPRWWTAPLAGSFAASLVFSALYYPAAFAGVYERWTDSAAVHFVVFFGMSVLLLAPYWLLRPAMRPMPGLNGY
jgi:uncharacterized PurR-regulated membrane protein YhhQ (DUF165 family)